MESSKLGGGELSIIIFLIFTYFDSRVSDFRYFEHMYIFMHIPDMCCVICMYIYVLWQMGNCVWEFLSAVWPFSHPHIEKGEEVSGRVHHHIIMIDDVMIIGFAFENSGKVRRVRANGQWPEGKVVVDSHTQEYCHKNGWERNRNFIVNFKILLYYNNFNNLRKEKEVHSKTCLFQLNIGTHADGKNSRKTLRQQLFRREKKNKQQQKQHWWWWTGQNRLRKTTTTTNKSQHSSI